MRADEDPMDDSTLGLRFAAALAPAVSVTIEPMFGGLAIMADGALAGLVYQGRPYLKVTAATRQRHERRGMTAFSPRPGVRLDQFFEIPPTVVAELGELAEWLRASLDETSASA
jgi:TfoX/Sxy family transcriptional regulator of competence genes